MRYILSILMLTCVTTFLQGCGGEEAPPEETFNEMDQLDPAEEAAAQKKAMQENWLWYRFPADPDYIASALSEKLRYCWINPGNRFPTFGSVC